MLVDHSQPERMRGARVADLLLAASDHDVAGVGSVIAHDALHQGALAGAVLAQQRVERTGSNLERYVVERREIAEPLGHRGCFNAKRATLVGAPVMRSRR